MTDKIGDVKATNSIVAQSYSETWKLFEEGCSYDYETAERTERGCARVIYPHPDKLLNFFFNPNFGNGGMFQGPNYGEVMFQPTKDSQYAKNLKAMKCMSCYKQEAKESLARALSDHYITGEEKAGLISIGWPESFIGGLAGEDGHGALDWYIEQIKIKAATKPWFIAEAYGKIVVEPERHFDPLIEFIRTGGRLTAEQACKEIGKYGFKNREVAHAIISFMKRENYGPGIVYSRDVFGGLVGNGYVDDKVIDYLLSLYERSEHRLNVSRRTGRPLDAIKDSTGAMLREVILRTLGELGVADKRVLEIIERAIATDPNGSVRMEAAVALGKVGDIAGPIAASFRMMISDGCETDFGLSYQKRMGYRGFEVMHPEALKHIGDASSSDGDDPYLYERSILKAAIAVMDPDEAESYLFEQIRSGDIIWVAAARILVERKGEEIVPRLMEMFCDDGRGRGYWPKTIKYRVAHTLSLIDSDSYEVVDALASVIPASMKEQYVQFTGQFINPVKALAEKGPAAKAALPALINYREALLEDGDLEAVAMVNSAIIKIDPNEDDMDFMLDLAYSSEFTDDCVRDGSWRPDTPYEGTYHMHWLKDSLPTVLAQSSEAMDLLSYEIAHYLGLDAQRAARPRPFEMDCPSSLSPQRARNAAEMLERVPPESIPEEMLPIIYEAANVLPDSKIISNDSIKFQRMMWELYAYLDPDAALPPFKV